MDTINPNNPVLGFDQPGSNFNSLMEPSFNGLDQFDVDSLFNDSDHFDSSMPANGLKPFDIDAFFNNSEHLDLIMSANGLGEPVNGLKPFDVDSLFNDPEPLQSSMPDSGLGMLADGLSEPGSNILPLHAPYSSTIYDPSMEIPYAPNDTDADKVRKWENLIAQANLAGAGLAHSGPQPIAQAPQVVDLSSSPSVSPGSLPVENIDPPFSPTPLAPRTPKTPVAPSISTLPATKLPAKKLPATKLLASNLPASKLPAPKLPASKLPASKLPANNLPRAFANEDYAKHISPFTPISTRQTPAAAATSTPTPTPLRQARQRIQSLAKERNYYQRSLRKATNIDPKTGKTSLQMLQSENTSLRRVNANQLKELEELRGQAQQTKDQYATLVNMYNNAIKQLHSAQLELQQLKGR